MLSIYECHHLVLVRNPVGESLHVFPHRFVRRVKQVGPILTDTKPSLFVDVVVAVPTDVTAPLENQHAATQLGGKTLGQDGAGEAGADDADGVVDDLSSGDDGDDRCEDDAEEAACGEPAGQSS